MASGDMSDILSNTSASLIAFIGAEWHQPRVSLWRVALPLYAQPALLLWDSPCSWILTVRIASRITALTCVDF